MGLRISTFGSYRRAIDRLRRVNLETNQLGERVASGRALTRPSDDPATTARALRYRDVLANVDQYRKNTALAESTLSVIDSALDTTTATINRIRELAVLGATGTQSAENRGLIAEEVKGLREQLLTSANTRLGDKYLFAGFASDQPAFDSAGTYVGDAGVSRVETGDGERTVTGIPGSDIFSPAGGVDVFAIVSQLETDLRANNAAGVQGSLEGLDTAVGQVIGQRSYLGSQLNRALRAKDNLDAVEVNFSKLSSQAEDLDMIDAISKFTQAQATLEATLKSTANILQTTLFNVI
ncbi:MAG: flagellar hook-associated protein FlgL [Myxococcales bacterium]|nr:flagellar hook-associated protein FlgL [Myxococcales bacterium]